MKYEIMGYKLGDEKEIGRLFRQSFGGRSLNFDNWEIVQENGNADYYCMANMWDGNKLIAHTELFTAQAYYSGEKIVSGTSGTTMADSAYLGAGAAVYKWIDKKYPDYIKIGFPNKNSFPLVKKVLKHNYLGEIDFWWKKLCAFQYELSDRYEVLRCSQVSENFDFEKECKNYQYSLARNRSFIKWRFLDRKSKDYQYFECHHQGQVVGYFVCSFYKDFDDTLHGQIVDVMAKNVDIFEQMIMYALDFFYKHGVSIAKIWMTDATYVEYLKKLGFFYGLRPFHMECWHHEIDVKKSYFTMADSDAF